MKSASSVALKWANRAGAASQDYVDGAQNTSKDQSALAIQAIPFMKTGINKAIDSGRVAKGLQRSGKAGWAAGIKNKGGNRYGEGVSQAQSKYATNSGAFDSARASADSLPRGEKGSPTNLLRVSTVVNALRKQKVGA